MEDDNVHRRYFNIPEGGMMEETITVLGAVNIPALTPARGEPMPKTIEHYKANALRDQELIEDLVEQACKDSMAINNLRQKLNKGKS